MEENRSMPPPARLMDASREEIDRIRQALRTAIRLSGVSSRQIERELEMSTGYLTRILAGHVELRMAHVLSVCGIIGLPAGNFFAALFPLRSAAGADQRMTRGLAELYPEPMQRRDPESLIQELRECVDQLETIVVERR